AALGCHPLSVVTALTVQDTHGVERVMAIEPSWISEQARRVLADIEVAAFKAGVLGSAQNVRAVSELVAEHAEVPFVVDPVLASARGARGAALHLAIARRRLQARRRAVPAEPLLPPVKLRGLYAVTPEGGDVERKLRLALEGGIALLQYRSKSINRSRAQAVVG